MIGVRWGARGEGGGEGEGRGMEGDGCWRRRLAHPMIRLPPCPPLPVPPPHPSPLPAAAPAPPWLAPSQPGRAPKRLKRRFLGSKTAFWRQKRFWCQKCILERKTENWLQKGKKGKRELKTPKKPLSRARFAQGCENDPKRCPNTQTK